MKITKFQVIVLGVFVLFIIAGVAAFATYKGSNTENALPAITIWGTLPKQTFDKHINGINLTLPQPISVTYVEQSEATFMQSFISALARGTGPDAILVSTDNLLQAKDKLTPIPLGALPQRTFIDSYIDAGAIYLSSEGIYGIPFLVDPLMMYWNRSHFNSAGIAQPPKNWSDFKNVVSALTDKNDNGTILQSAIALGDFSNINNAREILATLFFQAGNPITETSQGYISSTIKAQYDSVNPTLAFFTQFVDPNSEYYSWNRSWPAAKTAFLSGKLSTYFGFASELFDIRNKNPNLNFDVAPMPQSGANNAVYAKLYGFSIVKQSRNANAAYQIISIMTLPQHLATLSADTYLPSVSRAVLASGSTDPYITIFNSSALISRTWLDSSPAESAQIFADMTQAITSGQKSVYQAVSDAGNLYDVSLNRAANPQ